jgi:hypothetical protein
MMEVASFEVCRISHAFIWIFESTYGVGWTILIGKGGGGIFDFGFPPSISFLSLSG